MQIRTKLKAIIARLAEQRRDLDLILAALHELGRSTDGADTHPGSLEQEERRLIMWAMERTGGNQSEAARILGIGRDRLRYKARRYDLRLT